MRTNTDKIIKDYLFLIENLKKSIDKMNGNDFKNKDNWKYYAKGLALKLFYHLTSLIASYQETRIILPDKSETTIVDFNSIHVITRAAFETYLTLYYLFCDNINKDEKEFRFLAWRYEGLLKRQNFFPVQSYNIKIQKDETKDITKLRELLRKNNVYDALTREEKDIIIKGKSYLHLKTITKALIAGYNKNYFNHIYNYMSFTAHANSANVMQTVEAKTLDLQKDLSISNLDKGCLLLSKTIYSLSKLFPDIIDFSKNNLLKDCVTFYYELDRNINDTFDNPIFPFGERAYESKQISKSPKEVFVLGSYTQAIYAKWLDPNGSLITNAIAVASEPHIFWDGYDSKSEEIISRINIPNNLGYLEIADQEYNGQLGRPLDKYYLSPLGFKREDSWLCNLIPYYRLNKQQEEVIDKYYKPKINNYYLPRPSIRKLKLELTNDKRRNGILEELETSKADTIILQGDQPIKWFLDSYIDKPIKNLENFAKSYGECCEYIINSKKYNIFALFNPKIFSGSGSYSAQCRKTHLEWMKNIAS